MNKEEKELLLSVARILRAHLADHIHEGPPHKYSHDDWKDLHKALRPFEVQLGRNEPKDRK